MRGVHTTLDAIPFNTPFHGIKADNILEKGVSDEGYSFLKTFFSSASGYLNPHGEIYLVFSDMGDIPLLESLIEQNYFSIKNLWQTPVKGEEWTCLLYQLS